jgi:glyoxylase-like metal-dependent hydrolase (beta-lactamase superfamily II)
MSSNSILIKDERTILFDPGISGRLGKLKTLLKEDNLDISDVDLIIATHGHRDHCGSIKELQKISGARIAFHRLEKELIGFDADFYLEDRLDFCNINLSILHTPGHSPGSICLYSEDEKFLICGDLVFEGGIGRSDLYGGDMNQLLKSIEKVSKLDVEYLLPGHGRFINEKSRIESNFLQIKEWFF